jgi:hypothetical protein
VFSFTYVALISFRRHDSADKNSSEWDLGLSPGFNILEAKIFRAGTSDLARRIGHTICSFVFLGAGGCSYTVC